MPALAKFLHRIDPQLAGISWSIHQVIRSFRRGHQERLKQARLIRALRSKYPRP